MNFLEDIATLEAAYGAPHDAAIRKVARGLTPAYRAWIEASRFCVLTTVGPEGTDGSPRGDDGPVVRALDAHTLAMPDHAGNNRLDSLRNIVADGRVSLMFMVPGSTIVVRVNGTARITFDEGLRDEFVRNGKRPASVIVIRVAEVYFQCSRAIVRARLWTSGDESGAVPTGGDMLSEMTEGDIDAAEFDSKWTKPAFDALW